MLFPVAANPVPVAGAVLTAARRITSAFTAASPVLEGKSEVTLLWLCLLRSRLHGFWELLTI